MKTGTPTQRILRRRALPLLLALLPLAATASEPMQLPQPIHFSHALDRARVRAAVLTALDRRKWIAEADIESGFVAALHWRDHVLRVRVEYSSQGVNFVYVDSSPSLDYKLDNGVPYIHSKANQRLQQLGLEVRQELQLIMFDVDPVDVVPLASTIAAPPSPPSPPSAPSTQPLPAPPAGNAGAPAAPALAAGVTAVLAQADTLRSRPMADSDPVAALAAGVTVQLVSPSTSVAGRWWYVNTGKQVGWLPESALRLAAGNSSPAR